MSKEGNDAYDYENPSTEDIKRMRRELSAAAADLDSAGYHGQAKRLERAMRGGAKDIVSVRRQIDREGQKQDRKKEAQQTGGSGKVSDGRQGGQHSAAVHKSGPETGAAIVLAGVTTALTLLAAREASATTPARPEYQPAQTRIETTHVPLKPQGLLIDFSQSRAPQVRSEQPRPTPSPSPVSRVRAR